MKVLDFPQKSLPTIWTRLNDFFKEVIHCFLFCTHILQKEMNP